MKCDLPKWFIVLLLLAAAPCAAAAADGGVSGTGGDEYALDPDFDSDLSLDGPPPIPDPLEPFNRAMFWFNDKLYFYALKPVARGYSAVVPQFARVGVRRFFANITTPVRFANSVLQLNFRSAGVDLARFVINTTVGVAGFTDPARDRWEIFPVDEDFGQTLGRWGLGPGLYITWPVFGPSSARDTVGLVADSFANPVNYVLVSEQAALIGVKAYERVNGVSLDIGVYEDIKRDAFDPYIYVRDAWHQHRENLVME